MIDDVAGGLKSDLRPKGLHEAVSNVDEDVAPQETDSEREDASPGDVTASKTEFSRVERVETAENVGDVDLGADTVN